MAGPRRHVKISRLAELSDVPVPTIKHYLREGLLPGVPMKTSRNMSYYDPALVERIKLIKHIQGTRYLPLKVIKEVLDATGGDNSEARVSAAIARVLASNTRAEAKTSAELEQEGVTAGDLAWLERLELIHEDAGGAGYAGDDLELIRTLHAARAAGLDPDMLPASILGEYLVAIRALVTVELEMFRAGVIPKAGAELDRLTEIATTLSERLVLLLRRKLLIPTLAKLAKRAPPRRPAQRRARRRKR